MTRGMIGVKRIAFLRPVGQYLHKLAALQPRAQSHLQTLEHALSRHTGGDSRGWIVRRQSAAHGHVENFAFSREFPRERSTCPRIPEQQRLVMDQVMRRLWRAAFP